MDESAVSESEDLMRRAAYGARQWFAQRTPPHPTAGDIGLEEWDRLCALSQPANVNTGRGGRRGFHTRSGRPCNAQWEPPQRLFRGNRRRRRSRLGN